MDKIITIDSSIIEELFKTTKESIAKDDSRLILKWIKVEVENKKMTAVSVDGYMLSSISIDLKNEVEEPYSFFIKPFYIPKSKQGYQITFDCSDKEVVSVTLKPYTSDTTINYKITQPKQEFINWKQILPETDKNFEIVFNAGYLINILKGFKTSLINQNEVVLCFKKDENGINKIAPVILKQFTKVGIEKQALLLPIRRVD